MSASRRSRPAPGPTQGTEDGLRVTKLIASRGVASRREAERLVEEGRVKVNGEVIREVIPVDPDHDVVKVDDRRLPEEPELAYYLMYKPRGTITGRNDPKGRKSVMDLLPDGIERVEPVGRLDLDTEGALLLTNDGDLAHRLLHPSRHVPKRYRVKVWKTPSESQLEAIRKGRVYLDDGPVAPALVRVVETTEAGENTWIEITVTEGRNRLIRRLFQQLKHPVSKLRRETFATLSIRGMERGHVRALTGAEVQRLRDLADGLKPDRAGKRRSTKGHAKAKPKGRAAMRKVQAARKAARQAAKVADNPSSEG